VTFGAPAALWFLAVLPVIVLLHMLRARRQSVRISSVLLWQRAREDVHAHAPLRRVQRSLLLLLQLLAASALALALARPGVTLPSAGGQATVLVMDVSVRMQATDVAPSRFDAARAEAAAEIARSRGPVMIVRASSQPSAVTGFVSPAAARDALATLVPVDAPSQLDRAVTFALGQRTSGGRPRVVVFSDHVATSSPRVEYRVVGQSDRNVAITAVRAEPTPDGMKAIVQVHNASKTSERIPLTIALDGAQILSRLVDIPAATTVAIPIPVRGQGILRARIDPHDALTADDAGYAMIGEAPARVLVVGERDRTLEIAFQAAGADVTVARGPEESLFAEADLVVLNRTPPVNLPPGNYLLLATTAPNLPLNADGAVVSPHILRWSGSHPVMRFVDLRGVAIARTLAVHPRGGETLAEGEVPLIWAYEGGGLRAMVWGFALPESDLAVHPAFPILVRNAVSWLTGSGSAYEAGQPWIVPARGQTEAVLMGPDGTKHVLAARGGQFVVPALERVGIYTLQVGGRPQRIAVNPAPSAVDITPVRPPLAPSSASSEGASQQGINLAPALLIAALLVMLAEWTLWLRRQVPLRPAVSRPVIRR
jgi:Ca-activated chloride channel homolog